MSSSDVEVIPGPTLGPCQAWISGDDVMGCCASDTDGIGPELFDEVAVQATQICWELSARQFSGLCRSVVRPCRDQCGCFGGSSSIGMGAWLWTSSFYGGGGWAWRNECGDVRGCKPTSRVKLAGYPVRKIEKVMIGGTELPYLDDQGNPNWRLEGWRSLLRLAAPGPPVEERWWPACQDMDLEASQPGTFEITYLHGVSPPPLGVRAASELACELYQACSDGGQCNLPNQVSRIVRQGVTMDRIVPLAELLRTGATGLLQLDAFIATYNPRNLRRRSAVFSPDVTQFPIRTSTEPV